MKSENLALLGGTPVIDGPLASYRSLGEAEQVAVNRVMESQCLSGFYGSPGDEFLGGPEVRAFERAWSERFACTHAVSLNSATSGLIAAVGAIGISPGDEVIVPPWTMSATVTAPMNYGGVPVFADVDDETFCIDPGTVEALIGPKTRAIIAVNLFGHPARLAELRTLADRHGIYLIEDNAQAPLGEEHGCATGTVGHIGVFSLNYHKHIHTGEGGMCVTDDEQLAKRMQLIRNHGENVVEWWGVEDLTNMVGYNLRLTELQAAIGIAQLQRVDQHVGQREKLADQLSEGCRHLEGLRVPVVRSGCRHNFYCWTFLYNETVTGVSRERYSQALAAEGFPHEVGYLAPLYRLPMFRKRMALGRDGFPFTLTNREYPYSDLCPVTERLHEKEVLLFEPCAYADDGTLGELLVEAVCKVHRHMNRLRKESM